MQTTHFLFQSLADWAQGRFALAWRDAAPDWGGERRWSAFFFDTRHELARQAWRDWGDPLARWSPSPVFAGWRHQATPAWERRWKKAGSWSVKAHDVAALAPNGRLLSPKALCDWGGQLARGPAPWDDGPRWPQGWPGWGPVPGTGKKRSTQSRPPKRGDGARNRWACQALSGVEQLDELQGWDSARGRAASRWRAQASRILDERVERWEGRWPREIQRCWKRAGAKRNKAWG